MRLTRVLFSLFLLLGVITLTPALQPALAADTGCSDLKAKFDQYGGQSADVTSTLPQYCTATSLIQFILNVIFVLVGGVTIILIIVGGFRYITSGGNEEQATKGKQTVLYALVGLAVVMLSAAIVNISINLAVNGKAL